MVEAAPVKSALITVSVPCYNEEGNVNTVYERVRGIFESIADVRFQILFIDNASIDGTAEKLRALAVPIRVSRRSSTSAISAPFVRRRTLSIRPPGMR